MSQIYRAVREQFSQNAEFYARSTVHAEGDTLGVLVDFADPNGTERALDSATGTGFTAFAVAPLVAHCLLQEADTLSDRANGYLVCVDESDESD